MFTAVYSYSFTMVTVAVAGGTGNVGRTIVDALERSQKHDVIVLTRNVNEMVFKKTTILTGNRQTAIAIQLVPNSSSTMATLSE